MGDRAIFILLRQEALQGHMGDCGYCPAAQAVQAEAKLYAGPGQPDRVHFKAESAQAFHVRVIVVEGEVAGRRVDVPELPQVTIRQSQFAPDAQVEDALRSFQ